MSPLPIFAKHQAAPTRYLIDAAEHLASNLLRSHPELTINDHFRCLVPERLEDAPALHVDDLTTIARFAHILDITFLQDRAALRASAGDFVVSCLQPLPAFQSYCQDRLGLGTITWLWAEHHRPPEQVAVACWTEPPIRNALVRAIRAGALRYLHPHMGNLPTWTTALLLRRAGNRPFSVIAPPPELTRLVNDKIWFADIVRRLFGPEAVPHTTAAYNMAKLTTIVRTLAERSDHIVIKHPSSAGGAGNVVIEAQKVAEFPLGRLRKRLRRMLAGLSWNGTGPLLVGSWQTRVLCAPSVQLWIPPAADGFPIVEGVFDQTIHGPQGRFVGSRPADLPPSVTQLLVDHCWVLGILFQRLGYVGRCSFDTLLVGEDVDHGRIQFIECNGRWGGTSLPMTLMNRILGDWTARPFVTGECTFKGLDRIAFDELLMHFDADLYDARTGTGRLIFYNPGGIPTRSTVHVVGLGNTWEDADQLVRQEVPRGIRELTLNRGTRSPKRWARVQ